MGSRWVAAGMAAIAVAAGAAGCGSSSSDDKTNATTTTNGSTGFVEQANAVCRAASEKLVGAAYPTRPSEFPAWGENAKAAQDQRINGLRKLAPPAEQREVYEQMIDHLVTARRQTDGLIKLLASGATIRGLGRQGRANVQELRAVRRLATKLRLEGCQT